jgi:hypothetical protein
MQDNLPEILLVPSQLPSRGLSYPPTASISYKTYTFGEVKKASLSNLDLIKSLEIALSGIVCNFDKKLLTLMDALFIGVLRKVSTMGELKLKFTYVCKKCGNSNIHVFNHKNIEFNDISEEVKELPVSITLEGKDVTLSPLTVGDYFDLNNGKYSDIVKGREFDQTSIYAIMVRNMPFKEAYNLIYNLKNQEDIELLEYVDKLLLHNLKPLNAVCANNKCGAESKLKLEGQEALIMPFREGERTFGDRIRYGNAPKS